MATEHRYDPHVIEPRWQRVWEEERTWQVSNGDGGGARRGRGPRSAFPEAAPAR